MAKSARPANAPWLSPYVTLKELEKSVKFYEKAFGFKVRDLAKGEDGTVCHAEMTYQDELLMFGQQGAYDKKTVAPVSSGVPSPISLYIYVEDVDAFYKHAVAAGAESIVPPEDMFWGDRMCRIQDPEGYQWSFATHINQ